MIHFDNLSKRYLGGFDALKNINLQMQAGELAFLTGHSGAEKSTLLRLLMLLERPTSGTLLINGKNINRLANSKIPSYRRQLGVVFQDHQLLMDRSVFDNVAVPLQVAGQPREEIIVVKLVGGTDAYVRRPFLYSGTLIGLLGALGAAIFLVIGFWWLGSSVAQLSELYNSHYRLQGPGLKGCTVLLATGAGLGLMGSWIAVGRHLKDIKPR